jgi:pyridoxamine 5'-phosphate oxidase
MSLRDRRIQYETAGLDRGDLDDSPVNQWLQWYEEAASAGVPEPNAMVVSTVDADGLPDSRVVLARGFDGEGVHFYGNYESAKGLQLERVPRAAANFPWLALHRQVRLRGTVERLSAKVSDDYFASRPRDSQLGAWASEQSRSITGRDELERRFAEATARFDGGAVPRPPHWGGWLLRPDVFEFWQGRPNRLHDRFRYVRVGTVWRIDRLSP